MLLEKLLAIVPENSLNMSEQGNGYGNMNTPFCSHIVPSESTSLTVGGCGVFNTLELCAGKKY